MARDHKDRSTADLLRSAGASRQAALVARRVAAGWRRTTVWVHEPSYRAGVTAAQLGSGTARDCPADIEDRRSWLAGYAATLAAELDARDR